MRLAPLSLLLTLLGTSVTASQKLPDLRLATNQLSSNSIQLEIETEKLVREQMDCVLSRLNLQSSIEIKPWKRIYLDLQRGSLDGFFSAMPRRQLDNYAEISTPLIIENWYWFWRSEIKAPENWREGYRLGSILGSQQEKWLEESGYKIFMSAQHLPQLIKLLETGRIDAILVDREHFQHAINQARFSTQKFQSRFYRYVPLGAYFSHNFLQKNPEFLTQFNRKSAECSHQSFLMSDNETQLIEKLIQGYFADWNTDPEIKLRLKKINQDRKHKDVAAIQQIDKRWINAFHAGDASIIARETDAELMQKLLLIKQKSQNVITEIILADKQGMNIAVSDMTSDFFQGDEAKFEQASQLQEGQYLTGQIRYDASTGRFQVDTSFPIIDHNTSELLGVMIVGIDIEKALSLAF